MGFLNPLFLLAAAAVAVPLVLHLFHRHESRRVAFPALRYLQRTRKEHARTIRFRQLLLLLLRVGTLLLLVAAGARLFLSGSGGDHPPTALAIILDNSMSSGVVEGETRYLDQLKALALVSVAKATAEDRIWVVRAGEPWEVVLPGTPDEARDRILRTEVSAAPANLLAALERASALVTSSELPDREVHLLSDLQATAFRDRGRPGLPGGVTIVVHQPTGPPPRNRFLTEFEIGGGLTPFANERSQITARVEGLAEDSDPADILARLFRDERVRGATETAADGSILLPLGPLPAGRTSGFIEIDPDGLRDDDRRYFAFAVRPPPGVAVTGGDAFFPDAALEALASGGRAVRVSPSEADVLLAMGGSGIEGQRTGAAAIIVPSLDATLLPALNRRLAGAGIPWRYEIASARGELRVQENRIAHDLSAVRVTRHYALVRSGTEGETWASLSDGAPWIVTGETARGPYLLFSSPLEPAATNLPLSAAMIPLMEWMLGEWAFSDQPPGEVFAGEPLPLPSGTTVVESPDGTLHPVDGTQHFEMTRDIGIYHFLRGDSLLGAVAVNAPFEESLLERLEADALGPILGPDLRLAEGRAGWERAILTGGEGAELWRPLLLLALLFLMIESWVAAAGRVTEGTGDSRARPLSSPLNPKP